MVEERKIIFLSFRRLENCRAVLCFSAAMAPFAVRFLLPAWLFAAGAMPKISGDGLLIFAKHKAADECKRRHHHAVQFLRLVFCHSSHPCFPLGKYRTKKCILAIWASIIV